VIQRPFFCYYGGKWRVGRNYPRPEHETIAEPFAGGAGYSLRHPQKNVILIEKDPIIAGLWRYLIRVSSEEILRLPDIPADKDVDDFSLSLEQKWLIGFWLNKGAAQPYKRPSKWMRETKSPAASWWGARTRSQLASQVGAIRHWKIVEGSYESAPDVEATWFVDPPYVGMGKFYKHRDIDYAALGEWCMNRRGLTIVCENDGAKWLPFVPFSLHKGGKWNSVESIFVRRST
jgi:site-specific DNA-adenine methylase